MKPAGLIIEGLEFRVGQQQAAQLRAGPADAIVAVDVAARSEEPGFVLLDGSAE